MEYYNFGFKYKKVPNGYIGEYVVYCDYPSGYCNKKYFEVLSHSLPPLCRAAMEIGMLDLGHVKEHEVVKIVYRIFSDSGIVGFVTNE